MGLIDKIAARFGYQRRSYDAGQWQRLSASWSMSDLSVNSALWSSLRAMRARSRDLARNDAYARRFLAMCRTNIAGPDGMRLQAAVTDTNGAADVQANAIIEREWEKWQRRGSVEITGRMSGPGLDQLYAWTLARDGEVLVKRVRGANNRWGYTLQMLDVARLDETYNDDRPNGNVVRMSIEMDMTGRPVAYWLRKFQVRDAVNGFAWTSERERIPAEDIWHDFIVYDAEQIRGVPWMHAAMMRLWQLGKFDEAALVAARIGAGKLGVIESPNGEPPENIASGKDSAGNFLTDTEAGQYWTLPPGYQLKSWDPTYPAEAFDPFEKALLRGIASGLDVSYVSLANDLEGVNYSSIRQGVLDEREAWKTLQGHIASGFKSVAFRDWIETSLLKGALIPLPPSKVEKFDAPKWRCKRWAWVDPLKDRDEAVLAIDNRLKSRTQVAADEGLDIEDVFRELGQEEDLMKTYKVPPPVKTGKASAPGDAAGNQAKDDEGQS